jgi:hypothetical protein
MPISPATFFQFQVASSSTHPTLLVLSVFLIAVLAPFSGFVPLEVSISFILLPQEVSRVRVVFEVLKVSIFQHVGKLHLRLFFAFHVLELQFVRVFRLRV